jgi:hypothetical protein
MQSTIKPLGYVQFRSHRVHVSHDLTLDQYVCFKSNQDRCDLEAFDELEAAVDYILEPLSSLVYTVIIDEDDQTE